MMSLSNKSSTRYIPLVVLVSVLLSSLITINSLIHTSVSLSSRAATSSTTYFVDCSSGSDSANGTSQTTAWRTLLPVNAAVLQPGSVLQLKRGCSWIGPLTAKWNGTSAAPIKITAYGSGALPIIKNAPNENIDVTGSYQIIERIETYHEVSSTAKTYEFPSGCFRKLIGWKPGISIANSAHHNSIRENTIHNNAVGVRLSDLSHDNSVTKNYIYDNKYPYDIDPVEHPIGMMGVLLHGERNEIAYNIFESTNATRQGAVKCINQENSIELYKARANKIHHNISKGDPYFSEMGSQKSRSDLYSRDNVYAYNIHESSASRAYFINTRGEPHQFGPVWRTYVYNNTLYYTHAESRGIICSYCAGDILIMKNNIIWSNGQIIYAGGSPPKEDHNIYWSSDSTPVFSGLKISSTSLIRNPQFSQPANHVYSLQSNSPAINAGTSETVTSGWKVDFLGVTVPYASGVDIGAYEYKGVSPTTTSSTIKLTPKADTYVTSKSPQTNFIQAPVLYSDGSPDIFITYIKFDMTQLKGKTIRTAMLNVYIAAGSQTSHGLYEVVQNYPSGQVTYNDRPVLGARIGDIPLSTQGKWVRVDVSAFIRKAISSTDTSIAIQSQGSDSLGINSQETVNSPYLEVEI